MHNDRRGIYIAMAIIVAISVSIGAAIVLLDYDSNPKESTSLEKETIDILTEDHDRAQLAVEIAIESYENVDKDVSELNQYLDMNFNSLHKRYAFVIDYDTQKIVAHPNIERIGVDSFAIINASESTDSILENLEKNEGHWIYYDFENPETGNIEPKTSWLRLHDGLIFGSGFYN